jgi:lambda family phage minor tail protein L
MTTPTSIQTEIQKLDPSAIIELFQLRLTLAVNGIDTTFYYHAGTNALTGNVVFQGITYSAAPIEVDGFELTSKGTLPRPTMRIANVTGAISMPSTSLVVSTRLLIRPPSSRIRSGTSTVYQRKISSSSNLNWSAN